MESQIKKFATAIAKEISERSIMDIDNVALMLEVRIKSSMIDFLNEYSTKEEKEYLKLLTEQSKNKIGTAKYNELAYKLTFAKAKKAAANRAVNNIKREDNYEKLKSWVIERFGRDVYDVFVADEMEKTPVYSTNIDTPATAPHSRLERGIDHYARQK